MFVQKGMSSSASVPVALLGHGLFGPSGPAQATPVTRHREKSLIYAQGDKGGDLYVVEFGCVRVSQLTPEGRRLVTSFNFAGEVFGFEPGSERQCYAEALQFSGTRKIRIGSAGVDSASVMDLMLDHFARVQSHLLILGTQNAIERVAAFLVGLADRNPAGGLVKLPMSRSDIADHLGLTLETVSRAMHKLEELGLIAFKSARSIQLLDKSSMRSLGN